MPKVRKQAPETLQPYIFHGIDLSWRSGDKEAKGNCPFCSHEESFNIDIRTGVCKCWHAGCNVTGNACSFLRKFWDACDKATTDYEELQLDRKLEYPDTLMQWGVVRSLTTRNWLVPGFNAQGKLQQLYQRKQVLSKGVWHWHTIPTPKIAYAKANKEGHRLHGVNLYDSGHSTVYLCEGPWDGMALWEALRQAKQSENGLASTANVDRSLLGDASVLAVPGCNVFLQSWLPLFAGKVVNLMYDNDHPHKHPKTGKTTAPAGLSAMRRVAAILASSKKPPAQVNYLCWGEKDGYSSDLPSGYDVRDALNTQTDR